MFPARGERIERKAPPKILMQAQIGPPLFFNTSPRLSRKKCQPISPRSGEEHDASNQDVSRSRMPPIIRPERVAYFHVELDSHDVIVAEGAAAETFVDCDSRRMFHNAVEFAVLYPGEDAPRYRIVLYSIERSRG